jgi:hypothetical protein
MKKFKTYNTIFNDYSDNVCISPPIFSKIVGVDIIDNTISIVVEIDTLHEYSGLNKNFYLLIKKELEFEFIPPMGYEYLKTCFVDVPLLNTTTSGGYGGNSNINFNIDLNKKIYRIFVNEVKAIEENRDEKINSILENDCMES